MLEQQNVRKQQCNFVTFSNSNTSLGSCLNHMQSKMLIFFYKPYQFTLNDTYNLLTLHKVYFLQSIPNTVGRLPWLIDKQMSVLVIFVLIASLELQDRFPNEH